jgi:ribosome-binding factor A
MASVRLEKIAALVKKELSVLFQRNMSVLFDGVMITVTQVRVSPDMGVAKVYLSFFPTEKKKEGLESVVKHTATLRRMLGEKVGKQLRKIPELHFHIDDSLDYFEEIDRLLKK